MSDAIARQHAVRDNPHGCPLSTPNSNNPFLKIDNDGSVWISGIKYQPAPEPPKASIAEVGVEAAMTAADQGEYLDWASNNNDASWGNNESFDTATFLLAASDSSPFAQKDPPLYLDSGASAHISCVCSDFSEFAHIEPHTITGVSNSAVSATGMGTVEISLPKSSVHLILRNVLYAPSTGVHLISISRLDDSGHRLSFANGLCTMFDPGVWQKIGGMCMQLVPFICVPRLYSFIIHHFYSFHFFMHCSSWSRPNPQS